MSISRALWASTSWARVALSLVSLYACGSLILYLCVLQLISPVGGQLPTREIVQINPGMSVMQIGSLLAEKGFVKSALAFQVISVLDGKSRSLKAGDYALNTDMDIFGILRKLATGDMVLYPFTIPEGFATSEIVRLWEEKGFGKAESFSKALDDPSLREKYGIYADSLEGYLFPDTYLFPRGISEREAIEKMLKQFNRKVSRLMDGKSEEANLSRHEIISLASIIEKEAKVDEERPLISAVFHNRLKSGQKLESCATVLYSLGYPHRGLTYQDLKNTDSLYNTYIYRGLPPGPICNPGLKSIIAAINPSDDKYLYFVVKNDGTHYFTESYNDFLNAKKKNHGS